MTGCTVVVGVGGRTCGEPGTVEFTSRRGETFVECADHAVDRATVEFVADGPPPHPPTRTTKPYVLVKDDRIVGYAESRSPRVVGRAARLGAEIVEVSK